MTAIVKPTCKFCGSDKGFRELGTVRVDASRKLRSLKRDDAGKVTATWDYVDSEHDIDDDFEPDCVTCIECDREEARIEDLIGDPVMFEPGALVVCPDGLRGTVAHVDFERRRLTVQNWHEEFKFAEVTALAVAA